MCDLNAESNNIIKPSFSQRAKIDAVEKDVHDASLYLMRMRNGPGYVKLHISKRHTPSFTAGACNLFLRANGLHRGRCKVNRLRKYGKYLSELDPATLGPMHSDDGFLYDTMSCFFKASSCSLLEANEISSKRKGSFWTQYMQRRKDLSEDPHTQALEVPDRIVKVDEHGTPTLLEPMQGRKFIASIFAQLCTPTKTFCALKESIQRGMCFVVHIFSDSILEDRWQGCDDVFTNIHTPFSLEAVLCIMLTRKPEEYPWNV